MPGIYVRTISKFDWLDPEKKSFLTIPGSYWLCYKKNIYKFIFRYHRTMRNTEQFSYGRELLKVIRRIIKCHPSQGQQFGTKHLLVTYSYTSWTRQDKMFAILKFQQRKNAAAFSHAFVLTIQIPSSENSPGNVRCPVVDSHVPVDTDETAKSVICSTNEIPAKETETCRGEATDRISQRNVIEGTSGEVLGAIKTSEPQGNARDSANVRKNPDGSTKGTATCLANESTEFPGDTARNESASCDVRRHKRTVKRPVEDAQEQCSKRRRTEESKKPGATSQEAEPVQNARKEKSCFEDVAKDKINGCSSGLKLAEDFTKGDSAIDTKDGRDNNKDLPRQYFFEKEVDARQKRRPSTSLADQSAMREDLQVEGKSNGTSVKALDAKPDESDKRHALAGANKSHRTRKQRPRESEKRSAPENKVLRSSNITDLVMEGLMFTIRQDQDSVAVIEQKTKLEVDEVLENSEKAETKAGEKCLLNSSLLRLENMVTMFDSPHGKNERRKTAIAENAYTIPFANSSFIYPSTTVYNLDAYYVDRETNKSSVRICGEHNAARGSSWCRSGWEQQRAAFSCTENSDVYSASDATGQGDSTEWRSSEQSVISKTSSEVREKELRGAEREDVIPRSFQSTVFSKKNETIAEPRERNSLVDADAEVTHKCSRSAEGGDSPLIGPLSNSNVEERTSAVSAESRQRASAPRVISDKIIAIDLMPAALRNAVRSVCRSRGFPAASNGETLQRKRETERESGDASSRNRYAKSCPANNSSPTELDSGEMRRDGSSATTINDEDGSKCGSTSARGARETSDRAHCGSRRASSRHGSPRKLQDITEEFYHDLRAQNRDSAAQQRCLRQRRRGVNNGGDVKNGRMRIEMLKFIQDITEGARVVVRRLNVE